MANDSSPLTATTLTSQEGSQECEKDDPSPAFREASTNKSPYPRGSARGRSSAIL